MKDITRRLDNRIDNKGFIHPWIEQQFIKSILSSSIYKISKFTIFSNKADYQVKKGVNCV